MMNDVVLLSVDPPWADEFAQLCERRFPPNSDSFVEKGGVREDVHEKYIPTRLPSRSLVSDHREVFEEVPIDLPKDWQHVPDGLTEWKDDAAGFDVTTTWLTNGFCDDRGFGTFTLESVDLFGIETGRGERTDRKKACPENRGRLEEAMQVARSTVGRESRTRTRVLDAQSRSNEVSQR